MYAFVIGKLDTVNDGSVVLENNGIGYNIFVSNTVISRLPRVGSEVKLYTYTNVKEDSFTLFGFLTREDKAMFLKLINVGGVGCKLANQILSGVDATSLAIAIVNKDVTLLSKIKGIGKKTAERIILELKEKVDVSELDVAEFKLDTGDTAVNDAVMALVSLGIGKTEAIKAVAKAREKTDKTDMLITLALRNMDK